MGPPRDWADTLLHSQHVEVSMAQIVGNDTIYSADVRPFQIAQRQVDNAIRASTKAHGFTIVSGGNRPDAIAIMGRSHTETIVLFFRRDQHGWRGHAASSSSRSTTPESVLTAIQCRLSQ